MNEHHLQETQEPKYDCKISQGDTVSTDLTDLVLPAFGQSRSARGSVPSCMRNCSADLYSAMISLQFGFIRPAALAIRGALEILMTAAVIHRDANAYNDFRNGRLTLQEVQRKLAGLKSLKTAWGKLSGPLVYEPFESVGRSLFAEGDDVFLPIIPVMDEQ